MTIMTTPADLANGAGNAAFLLHPLLYNPSLAVASWNAELIIPNSGQAAQGSTGKNLETRCSLHLPTFAVLACCAQEL